jgi:hypothetical protein
MLEFDPAPAWSELRHAAGSHRVGVMGTVDDENRDVKKAHLILEAAVEVGLLGLVTARKMCSSRGNLYSGCSSRTLA